MLYTNFCDIGVLGFYIFSGSLVVLVRRAVQEAYGFGNFHCGPSAWRDHCTVLMACASV